MLFQFCILNKNSQTRNKQASKQADKFQHPRSQNEGSQASFLFCPRLSGTIGCDLKMYATKPRGSREKREQEDCKSQRWKRTTEKVFPGHDRAIELINSWQLQIT